MEQTSPLAAKVKIKTLTVGNRGFTLFELIVVLVIIGITASVVFFSTAKLHDKTLFNEETRRIVQTLKHARAVSLLDRKNVEFRIDDEGKNYWVIAGDDDSLSKHMLPQKFTLSGEAVIFFPKGNSSGGSLIIDDGKGRKFRIEIDSVLGTPSVKRV